MEVNREEWDDYLSTLSPTAAALLNAIINPPEVLRGVNYLDRLRYLKVKMQSPSARIRIPRYRLDHLSLIVHVPVEELRMALSDLKRLIPTTAWDDLIED
jgi:hypothetical protein